jgi:hypothetical protein
LLTRLIGNRISFDRPIEQVGMLFLHEISGPRPGAERRGGPVLNGHVRVNDPAGGRRSKRRRGLGQRRRRGGSH